MPGREVAGLLAEFEDDPVSRTSGAADVDVTRLDGQMVFATGEVFTMVEAGISASRIDGWIGACRNDGWMAFTSGEADI